MPRFSIIVPIHKVEKYLRECIESVLHQTYENFELILVDDGSPDGCGRICDEYARRDRRIRVVHKKNGGLISARKAGVEKANGEYILNVDGDDYIGKELLQKINNAIEETYPDLVAFGFTKVQNNGTKMDTILNEMSPGQYSTKDNMQFRNGMIYDRSINRINIGSILPSICSKAVKRSILATSINDIPNDITNGEDVAITFSALQLCDSVCVSPISDYFYRTNEASITNTFKKDAIRRQRILFDYMSHNLGIIPKDNIDTYAYNQILLRVNQAACGFDCYGDYKEYLKTEMTPDVTEIVRKTRIPPLCLKHRLLFILLKYHAYGLLWLIFRMKQKKVVNGNNEYKRTRNK